MHREDNIDSQMTLRNLFRFWTDNIFSFGLFNAQNTVSPPPPPAKKSSTFKQKCMNNYWHIICIIVYFYSLLLCFPELNQYCYHFYGSVTSGDVNIFSQFLWRLSVFSFIETVYPVFISNKEDHVNIQFEVSVLFSFRPFKKKHIKFDILWVFLLTKYNIWPCARGYLCIFRIWIIHRYTGIYLKFQLIEVFAILCLTNMVII